jgi:TPR repeat protein
MDPQSRRTRFCVGPERARGLVQSRQGLAQDHAEAAKWFRRAAEQGNADAQNNLGAIYAEGQGVPRDMIGAYTWLSLAATAGNQSAAKNLDIAA